MISPASSEHFLRTHEVDRVDGNNFGKKFYSSMKELPEICTTWSQYHSKGGYPVYSTNNLNRHQIYVYYLMAELVVAEASQIRTVYESHKVEPIVWGPEIDLFSTFMEQVNS